MTELQRVIIYTDGACLGNPGPGGYGVVILRDGLRQELSGGYRLTTNNRMEILAVIRGLESLQTESAVTLYSDSQYLVKAMMEGWARRWKATGWRLSNKKKALNVDLWARALDLCARHDVRFIWVKGHAGNKENERCDKLAVLAASQNNLPPDAQYEQERASEARSSLFD